MSKYCPNCGASNYEEAKFCTTCGASLKKNSSKNDIEKNDDILIEESLNQPNKGSRIFTVLIGIGVLTILFFIGKSFLAETEPIDKPFSITEQLQKLEGKWHDPTGVLLENEDAVIKLTIEGEKIIGKDENDLIEIEITPFGSNNYGALVDNRGVKGDFELHFYEEENKLVFFSTLTKSSWYIKKLNN